MSLRSHKWLRGFLNLGARASQDGIPEADVRRQEETVLRALETLDERPGVILADEVGMGKTFEALGVAAAAQTARKRAKIVVITPGPDLNRKWVDEFSRFRAMYDFGESVGHAKSLKGFVTELRSKSIVVAPVTMFQGGRGDKDQAHLLSLYFHWKSLHGKTANAIMRRFRDGKLKRLHADEHLFLGSFELEKIERHLGAAFRRGRSGPGSPGLDELYEEHGVDGFKKYYALRDALYRARFILARSQLPEIELLVVDEAHKLKNSRSLRAQGMSLLFRKRFNKALFLTATPFQLDISELRDVFGLFRLAKSAHKELQQEVEDLLIAVRDYQHAYDGFQRTWSMLDPIDAAGFRVGYDKDPERYLPDDENMKIVLAQIRNLQRLKSEKIEPEFRKWMIRSLRPDKREYRDSQPRRIEAKGSASLPFLIYERFIAELFRRGRQTHKAAVEINMVSSYDAATGGAIMQAEQTAIPPEADTYRHLLRGVLQGMETASNDHPKIKFDVADALSAADKGEKTLIFCSRVATLAQLRRTLQSAWEKRTLDSWRRSFPGASRDDILGRSEQVDATRRQVKGRHGNLQQRFHRQDSALYLALRERYLRTVVPISGWVLANLHEVTQEANHLLAGISISSTAAGELSYQAAKRCVEQAAVRLWDQHGRAVAADASAEAIDAILSREFLTLGLDLEEDDHENDPVGDDTATWVISPNITRLVVGQRDNVWEELTALLNRLPVAMRVRVVEQLARYLTRREIHYLPDLLAAAKAEGLTVDRIEQVPMLNFCDRFWSTGPGLRWSIQVTSFLEYFVDRDERQQLAILDGPLRTAQFVRHTRDGESREMLREAFNTPLFPMVLVANEVMQEGLDLHRNCRRIIHHDLVWNPAQIEQRIGRIDRLGSKLLRLRESDRDAKLEVLYPVVRGTIDERMYRVVKAREKWLEFLLGGEPQFGTYELDEDEPPELPSKLARQLAIDLGPRRKVQE